jgi:hypothetical protein
VEKVSDHGDHRAVPGVLSRVWVRIEKVPQLLGKAPSSQDFEDPMGLACESASVRQVASQYGARKGTTPLIAFEAYSEPCTRGRALNSFAVYTQILIAPSTSAP